MSQRQCRLLKFILPLAVKKEGDGISWRSTNMRGLRIFWTTAGLRTNAPSLGEAFCRLATAGVHPALSTKLIFLA